MGFPYLYVELGLDRGWVHVIDNEDRFNGKLGLQVVLNAMGKDGVEMY